MPNKSVILTIMVMAAAFGVMVSGCNRDNRTAMNNGRNRDGSRFTRSARPAEVLSGQAYRPPVAARHYEPAPQTVQVAQAPTQFVGPVYTAPPTDPIPVYVPSAYGDPVVVYPTPELAVARASLPQPQRAVYQPTPPVPYRAPIPELEPVRYQRLPAARTTNRPSAEIMMSKADRREIQRALEPLAQSGPASAARQGWVASPATAMYY